MQKLNKGWRFLLWLGDFVEDGTTGKPSVKRYGVALGSTVLAGVMLGLGFVIGLSVIQSTGDERAIIVGHATTALSDVLMWFTIMVTGNYAGGKLIEKAMGKNDKSE